MKRARWIPGALGAVAALSVLTGLPASADSVLVTKITNVADQSRWVAGAQDAVIGTLQPHAMAQPRAVDEWLITKREDGSVTVRSQQNRQCVTARTRAEAELRTAPCEEADPTQSWTFHRRNDGAVVISPSNAPKLVVAVRQVPAEGGNLRLTEREQVNSSDTKPDTGAMDAQAFRLDI